MKKLYSLLFFLFTILQFQAQCNTSLSTPYGYNANNNGIMFNITAGAAPITITSFDMNLMSGTYEIYYMPGSYVGSESTAGSWTKAGTAAVTSLGTNLPTPIPIPLSITVPANTTFGFYITSNNGSYVMYNVNSGYTNIASNTDIIIAGGASIAYPFTVTIPNRSVNCTPHYTKGPSITTTGTLIELDTKTTSQNASLPYTATTDIPTSYSIDWNAAANTAGLTDQASTNFAFTSGAGNLNTISVPANLPAGTYTGNLTIRNAGNCTNATTQPITLKINTPFTCPADITVPNDAGICGAVLNYTLPVVTAKKLDVLVLGGLYESDVRQKLLSTNQFNSVDAININNSTPDLSTLQKYDAVLLYTFGSALNSVQLGNTLAQYIDGGGGVVDAAYEATFSHILGAYDTDVYRVLNTSYFEKHGQVSLGTIDLPSHPIMKDVTSFNGGTDIPRNDSNVLTPNSYVIARYNNNDLLVMAKENVGPLAVRRVCLNFFPPSSTVSSSYWNTATDGAKLMANALKWVGNRVELNQTAGLASGAVFPVGTITNTFEYTDANGDLQTCSFNVVVNDTEAPVTDLPKLPTIIVKSSLASITAPTATDNCSGAVTGTTTTTFPITASTTVVWTYTDADGNSVTQNQQVVITPADTTVPNDAGICAAVVNYILPVTASKPKVLVVGFDLLNQNSNIKATLDATQAFSQVDTFTNVLDFNLLTLAYLKQYDAVFLSLSHNLNTTQKTTAGNIFSSYIDGGGIIVDAYESETADAFLGTYNTDNYRVLNVGTFQFSNTTFLGPLVSGHPIFNGVNSLTFGTGNAFINTTSITSGSVVIAEYSNGIPLVIVKENVGPSNVRRVTLNMVAWTDQANSFGWDSASDGGKLIANTLTWAINKLNVNQIAGLASGDSFPVGTTTNTFEFTDVNGDLQTFSFDVVVTDDEGPVADATILSAITEQCSVASIIAPTATDNCIGLVTGTTTTTFPITASTTVVWTYTDGTNTSTQNQIVTIADTMAPVADITTLPIINEQCEVTAITPPTATDNCIGAVTGTTTTTFPITASTTVVWTYTDGRNSSTQNQIVTIADTMAPVADVITLSTITAQCEVATMTPPTATDNCIGGVTGTTTTTFPITASTTVVWTYTDGTNSSTQNQTVTIADTVAPVSDVVTLAVVNGQCEVTAITPPTATDNCIGGVTGTTTTSFPITASTTVVWTYSDGINISTQNQIVTIADTMAPVADAVTLSTITAQCEVASITAPTATDNCIGAVTGTTTTTFPITASTTVVWTYSDGINISTQNQTVTIADTMAPVADAVTLSTITAQCEVISIIAPTATDNCIGGVTGTTTTTFPITASTTVVWTYSDGINISTQNQTVTIADTTSPVADVTTLPAITAQCEIASITAPTATDNCIGGVTGTTTTTFPITASTTVVWTYSDGINTSTQNQTVTIADTTAPVADAVTLSTITAQCEIASITAPTATDNCIGGVTGTTATTFPITASTTVVWTYSDGINTSTQNQTVTIADTVAPIADAVTLSTITAQCEIASITAPTATDNCIGGVTGTTATTFPITASTTVVWTYSDGINTSTQNQTVTIADTVAPIADAVTLSTITAQCEVASITAPTATDNCIGGVTGTTATTFPITASTTVVWTYSDGINTSTQNQTVTIADTVAPIADAVTLSTITAQCEVASITAPTATDNCIGAVTGTTATTFPITASTTVVWTYSDGINTSTQNQTVTIADTVAPIADAVTLSTITAQCEVASITAPTATDNCIGGVTGTTTTTFPITASTTVVWTYSDGINTSTQIQTVTIVDTTTPVVITKNITIQLNSLGNAAITTIDIDNGSTDNCGIASMTLDKNIFNCSNVGVNTVSLTVTDTSGNSASQTASVLVEVAPIVNVSNLSQQFCAVDQPLVSDISIPYRVLNWFADSLSTAVVLPLEVLRSGIYYAEVSINVCNTSRIPVTIIVNDEASPTGNAIQYFCRENKAAISDLITNEKEILWYDTASGGVPLDSDTLLEDKHKYYASYFDETCESSKRFEVEVVFNYCEVIINNGISANGDGKNDYFNIEGASTFKDNQLEIFNSWGSLVYEIKNYGQADNLFKGYANKGIRLGNGLLPFGTYYYVFSFTNHENKRITKKGFLHLNP